MNIDIEKLRKEYNLFPSQVELLKQLAYNMKNQAKIIYIPRARLAGMKFISEIIVNPCIKK